MSGSHDASIAQGSLPQRLWRRLRHGGGKPADVVATDYAGLVVLDRAGRPASAATVARDLPRVFNELGIGRCTRLFGFCAGPGYVGYALLANGWCETLALSDVDAEAVATAMRTAKHNGIEHRVTGYASDALDAIPEDERWDVVVAHPPAFSSRPETRLERGDWDRGFDANWDVRRRFYAAVKTHMRTGGVVVAIENLRASDPDVFAAMIRAGGGVPHAVHVGTDVQGRANGAYYQLSVW